MGSGLSTFSASNVLAQLRVERVAGQSQKDIIQRAAARQHAHVRQ
ncbi:MAG: hypothetical protein ACI82G_003388, partial [Bradymonadia bacterium]